MTTLWDTTGTEVVQALSAERRRHGAVSSGLALTLVVVTDEKRVSQAEEAATAAAAQHPCRLLLVVRRRPDAPEPRLDAEVLIGDRLGPGEAVVMRMYGRLALHAESVVLPLLAPDAPVVAWWIGEPPHLIAHDPLGVSAGRRVTDCAEAPDPMGALLQRAQDYVPGDTDLSWSRTTLWRGLIASGFDSVVGTASAGRVTTEPGNPSGALLAGWLRSRLQIPVDVVEQPGAGIQQVELDLDSGPFRVRRQDARTAVLEHGDGHERVMPLPRRELGDLLAEELRRLDADETYAEALAAATGSDVPLRARPGRTHVWLDPALAREPEPAITTT